MSSEYIVLKGTDEVSLKLPLNIANMCGTLRRMIEMADVSEPIEIPLPFSLDIIGNTLKEYLEMHRENPEFLTYRSLGCHGDRKSRQYEPWSIYTTIHADKQWCRGNSADVLHRLYHLSDFLEVQSLMDLCTYTLNSIAFDTLYDGKLGREEKAIVLREILFGNV